MNWHRIALLVCLSCITVGGCGFCVKGCAYYDYSEGYRQGTITKFSRKGIFWKTWEGEMVLGGVRSTSDGGMIANTWTFSLDRQTKHNESLQRLVEQLVEAQQCGSPTRLHYNQSMLALPWRGNTHYWVDRVEIQK